MKTSAKQYQKRDRQLGIIPKDGFMRLDQFLSVIPIGKTSLYEGISKGLYPAPVKLSERTSAWRVKDVRTLVEQLGGEA